MKRTEMLHGVRRMKVESVLDRGQRRALSQAKVAEILGMTGRKFRGRPIDGTNRDGHAMVARAPAGNGDDPGRFQRRHRA